MCTEIAGEPIFGLSRNFRAGLIASSDPKQGTAEMFYRLGQWLLPRAMFKPFFPILRVSN